MIMNKLWKSGFITVRALIAACALLAGCGSGPTPVADPIPVPAAPAPVSSSDELDTAIREASNYLNSTIPKGSKIVILNVQSGSSALSDYVIDELLANAVKDRVFSVVDRQQLNLLRAELNFQYSGEVDDNTQLSLGKTLGAQTIVSGAVSQYGEMYRIRIRALEVQTAQVQGQFNRNFPNGTTIAALMSSQSTTYSLGGSSQSAPAPASGRTTQTAQANPPAPAPESLKPAVYKIGDKGPAGGWIFYDKGVVADGWRYLEAAPHDIGRAQWGANNTDVAGTSIGTGSGKPNTQTIIAKLRQVRETGRAAQICTEEYINGHNDWFLPSQGELNMMYRNLKQQGLGDFDNTYYWSSSQSSNRYSWAQDFSNGMQTGHQSYYGDKDYANSVRAIRQF